MHLIVSYVVQFLAIYDTSHHRPIEEMYPIGRKLPWIYDQFYKEFVENDVFHE